MTLRALLFWSSLLLAGPALGAGEIYLGEVSEGDDKQLRVVYVDADGDEILLEQINYWVQTNPMGSFPEMLYAPAPIVSPAETSVALPLPPDVQRIVQDGLDAEEHVIVVQVQFNGKYKNDFLMYRVKNRPGMHVVGGVLVPEPTPTP